MLVRKHIFSLFFWTVFSEILLFCPKLKWSFPTLYLNHII
jgi:hypothetical protein